MTYNIFNRHARWDARRRLLTEGLRILSPDVIAFQETVLLDGYDQAAGLLDSRYTIVHSETQAPDGVGVSIASRWPIVGLRELDLHATPRTIGFPVTTMLAEIDAPEPFGRLLFVNHFPSYQVEQEYERELQAVIAARAIEVLVAETPMHVVLAGDLDAEPNAASVRFLLGKQSLDGMSVCYRGAWDSVHPGEAGLTLSAENLLTPSANWDWPYRRIDHILVRHGEHGGPSLRIVACELAFDEPVDGVWASDHFGVAADLAIPAPRMDPEAT